MEKNINLKAEIAKRVGVAITVSSFWSLYNLGLEITAGIIIAILVASCVILPFRERLSHTRWRRFAEASEFELTFTALGLGMILAGSRLVVSEFLWWGISTMMAGALFIGFGIGENLVKIIDRIPGKPSKVT
jgi:hypothetical protein